MPVDTKEGISLTWLAGAGNASNATYTIDDGTTKYKIHRRSNCPAERQHRRVVCSEQHAVSNKLCKKSLPRLA